MKKYFKKVFLMVLGLSMAIGFGITHSRLTAKETEAALVETNRAWMKNSITNPWDNDSARTNIHYWGGSAGTTWPGVNANWDGNNQLVYYDIPADATHYMWVRSSPTNDYWGAKTDDIAVSGNVITRYFDMNLFRWEHVGEDEVDYPEAGICEGVWDDFVADTTWAVANYAATIDTTAKACSQSAAQKAVDDYNLLSTFEQNQFDELDVGGGKTGLDRLLYLINYYNIQTPLNTSDNLPFRIIESNVKTYALIALISLSVGLTGYYFTISRKKIKI